MNKHISITLSTLAVVALIIAVSNSYSSQPKGEVESVAFIENLAPVKILESYVKGSVINAVLKNDSDVPVTQIVAQLDCKDSDSLEIRFAEEYSQEEDRYFATSLDIGESKLFNAKVSETLLDSSKCTLEVKYWSKYGNGE